MGLLQVPGASGVLGPSALLGKRVLEGLGDVAIRCLRHFGCVGLTYACGMMFEVQWVTSPLARVAIPVTVVGLNNCT